MDKGLISTRYARSLLDYAITLDQQDEVYKNVKILSEVFWEVPELRVVLINSSIRQEERLKILYTAAGDNLPSSLKKMADMIFINEREDLIQYIALRYIELYRDRFKILHGKIITAVHINKEEIKSFQKRIQKLVGENLELDPLVDPDIIGGFVLHLDDYRWDASVAGELTRIKSHFKKIEAVSASQNK
jgi:F-type H+-transporting ATPase subunit delta